MDTYKYNKYKNKYMNYKYQLGGVGGLNADDYLTDGVGGLDADDYLTDGVLPEVVLQVVPEVLRSSYNKLYDPSQESKMMNPLAENLIALTYQLNELRRLRDSITICVDNTCNNVNYFIKYINILIEQMELQSMEPNILYFINIIKLLISEKQKSIELQYKKRYTNMDTLAGVIDEEIDNNNYLIEYIEICIDEYMCRTELSNLKTTLQRRKAELVITKENKERIEDGYTIPPMNSKRLHSYIKSEEGEFLKIEYEITKYQRDLQEFNSRITPYINSYTHKKYILTYIIEIYTTYLKIMKEIDRLKKIVFTNETLQDEIDKIDAEIARNTTIKDDFFTNEVLKLDNLPPLEKKYKKLRLDNTLQSDCSTLTNMNKLIKREEKDLHNLNTILDKHTSLLSFFT